MRKLYLSLLILAGMILALSGWQAVAARNALASLFAGRPATICTDSDAPPSYWTMKRKRMAVVKVYWLDYRDRTNTSGLPSQITRTFAEMAMRYLVSERDTEAYFQRTRCNFRRRTGRPWPASAVADGPAGSPSGNSIEHRIP